MNWRRILLGSFFLFVLTLFPGRVFAAEVGSSCASDADCDFNGGVCWPEVDSDGKPTGSGTCTSEKLLTYQEDEGDQLLAANTSNNNGSVLGISDWWNSLWNNPTNETAATKFFQPDTQQTLEKTANGLWHLNLASAGCDVIACDVAGNTNAAAMQHPGAAIELAQLTDTMIWNQPANTVEYIADIGRNAGFINEAYAQGTGWKALNPVLKIWKAFRNMAYFAFVVIFVVIGFLIMMRKKLGGQAVVTIQMALPQIIITLLLITFSYAIVALLIDLIYVLIYFVVAMFATFGVLTGDGVNALDILMTNSIFGIAMQHLVGWSEASSGAGAAVNDIVTSMFSNLVGEAAGEALGSISGVLGYLIIAVIILFSVFKVFFQLLKAYIGIIFGIIFAPIILLANAIPGSGTFMKWFKSILANALVFPAVAVMILVGVALIGENNSNSAKPFGVAQGVGYDPQQAQDVALPFLSLNTSGMIAIVGLAVIVMLPHATELVQKALGVDASMAGMMNQAMGGALNTGVAPFKRGYDKWREQQADVRQAKLYGADMSNWRGSDQAWDWGKRMAGFQGRQFEK